jgi:hypothetical protein
MSRNKYKPAEYVGQKFGSLLVLSVAPTNITAAVSTPMFCRCDCGTEKRVSLGNLLRGNTLSCGCRRGTRHFKHGLATRDHSLRPRAYSSWVAAKERCFSPGSAHFDQYGARGIVMCERWRWSFTEFLSDMGERPEGFTLERIDVNGNYEPGNCKWIPANHQTRNTRSSIRLEVDGSTLGSDELAAMLNRDVRQVRGWHTRGILERNVRTLLPDRVVRYATPHD